MRTCTRAFGRRCPPLPRDSGLASPSSRISGRSASSISPLLLVSNLIKFVQYSCLLVQCGRPSVRLRRVDLSQGEYTKPFKAAAAHRVGPRMLSPNRASEVMTLSLFCSKLGQLSMLPGLGGLQPHPPEFHNVPVSPRRSIVRFHRCTSPPSALCTSRPPHVRNTPV